MTIDVLILGDRVPIDKVVFTSILENSVASTYAAYGRSLEKGSIDFQQLVYLARKGEIPFTLFFAPRPFVEAQIKAKTDKLLSGLTKETFSVNSRGKVELGDIELIVKDLLRKQELLKKHDGSLVKNKIIGLLGRPRPTVEEDAGKLLSALGLTHEDIRSAKNKEAALDLWVERLEANQVLVSRSVNNYMPQRLPKSKFSGITIKDTKVPYIFLAGGDHGDFQEPAGRRLFTLVLMSVLVARRIFAPVAYNGHSTDSNVGREYDIVGAILMPRETILGHGEMSLDEVRNLADMFKVTPSALTVRAQRLGLISREIATVYLDDLAQEFLRVEKSTARSPKPVNAVRRYNGREFSTRMLDVLDSGRISPKEFCRSVCLNKIKPSQINDFREAL